VVGELELYMRGVQSSDLETMLDLLYLSRVKVGADRLEQVDTLAEELQMRVLVI
jgi:hypothetical protein